MKHIGKLNRNRSTKKLDKAIGRQVPDCILWQLWGQDMVGLVYYIRHATDSQIEVSLYETH